MLAIIYYKSYNFKQTLKDVGFEAMNTLDNEGQHI